MSFLAGVLTGLLIAGAMFVGWCLKTACDVIDETEKRTEEDV